MAEWQTIGDAAAPDKGWQDVGRPEAKKLIGFGEAPGLNLMGAVAEPLLSMGSSMLAKPASDIAGLGAIPLHAAGLIKTDPTQVKEAVQRGGTYEPRTQVGKAVTEYNPLALFGKAVGALGEKAKGAIATPEAGPLRSAVGSGVGEFINQLPQVLGVAGASRLAKATPGKQAALDVAKGENAMIDATREQSQGAGYITPPEHGVKAAISGLGGSVRNERLISQHNTQTATNELGREVGISPGTPLSAEVIENQKQQQYKIYDAMKDAVGPKVKMTDDFKNAVEGTLDRIGEKLSFNREQYRSLIPVQRLYRAYMKKFDPIEVPAGKIVDERGVPLIPATTRAPNLNIPTKTVVDSISELRSQAKDHFKKADSDLGYAKLGLAQQMEGLLEDSLARTGRGEMVDQFKAARTKLAQLHFLDRVVNDATGQVDLAKVASLSDTKAYKGVLTGAFKDAADFAKTFPKAARKSIGEEPPRLTVFDLMFLTGGLGGALLGHPGALGAAAAEIGTRVAIPFAAQRGMLQNRTPSYQASRFGQRALPVFGMATSAGAGQPPPQ